MLSLEKSKEYKQPDNTSAKGVGYPYYAHVGEVVEVDGKTDDLSIFKMNVALSYMEYGDQLVIVSFHKLREHGGKAKFIINDHRWDDVYATNRLYIDRVISLADREALDLIAKFLTSDYLHRHGDGSCVYFLNEYGFNDSAQYMKRVLENILPPSR